MVFIEKKKTNVCGWRMKMKRDYRVLIIIFVARGGVHKMWKQMNYSKKIT